MGEATPGEWTSARTWLLIELAALVALATAVFLEKRLSGIETNLLLVIALTAPLHVRRWLAIRGAGPAPGRISSALEAAALVGAASAYPPDAWALSAACGAAVIEGSRADDLVPAPRVLRAFGLIALLIAAVAAWDRCDVMLRGIQDLPPTFAMLVLPALLPTIVETCSPGATRSAQATIRRIAVAATGLAAARADQFPGETLGFVWLSMSSLSWLAVIRHDPSSERMRVRRLLVKRVTTSLGAVALMWLAGELVFRLVPNDYRALVPFKVAPVHVPGATTVYEGAILGPRQSAPVVTRWSLTGGWHDVEHETTKSPATVRILVLGDSYVEGVQVDVEDLYHRRMERALTARGEGAAECIALGESGWGQADELRVLVCEGLRYRPDLIVVEFLPGNDIRNNNEELERLANAETRQGTLARIFFLQAVNARLAFSAFVMDHADKTIRNLSGRKDGLDMDVYREPPRAHAALWLEAWARTERLLEQTREQAIRSGAKLAVVIFTCRAEIESCVPDAKRPSPEYDFQLPARRMIEICQRLGVPCLNLAPRFARLPASERDRLHLVGDGHWSAAGHRQAAAETVTFLAEETNLWREAVEREGRGRSK